MLNLNSIMVGSQNVEAMADYYTKIFDKPADMQEDGWHGWSVGSCFFSIGEHSEVSGQAKQPARLMFTLETKEVQAEYDRMVSAGATSVKEPYDMGGAMIATLSDPDGNYFQLMTPWEDMQNQQ